MTSHSKKLPLPGSVLKIRYALYTHYAIVSDTIGPDDMPMVIDNSAARGTVTERPWSEAVSGKRVSLSEIHTEFSKKEVLQCAKKLVGRIKYSLLGFNCESFVRKTLGLLPSSKQVKTSAVTVPSAMYIAHKASNGNKWVTGIAGLLTLAVITKLAAK